MGLMGLGDYGWEGMLCGAGLTLGWLGWDVVELKVFSASFGYVDVLAHVLFSSNFYILPLFSIIFTIKNIYEICINTLYLN